MEIYVLVIYYIIFFIAIFLAMILCIFGMRNLSKKQRKLASKIEDNWHSTFCPGVEKMGELKRRFTFDSKLADIIYDGSKPYYIDLDKRHLTLDNLKDEIYNKCVLLNDNYVPSKSLSERYMNIYFCFIGISLLFFASVCLVV